MIELAEFAPDRSQFDPSATDTLRNFVPRQGGWGPFPAFVPYSQVLPGPPLGAFLANLNQGDFQLFAATQTRLYKLNSTSLGWDDVTRQTAGFPVDYTGPANRQWSFTQYGTFVVATNGVDPIQAYDTASPSQFSALSADAPTAMNIDVFGDFLFATNTSDGERAARWSGLNNSSVWRPGDLSSDLQLFPDGGDIQGCASFESGAIIFQEDCIRGAQLALNTPLIMTFGKTVENHGALARKSIVSTAAGVFYLSQDGFYRYGMPPVGIGAERVNNFFFADVALDQIGNVIGTEDPYRSVVYWAYTPNSSSADAFSRVLCYHYAFDKWTLIDPGVFMTGLVEATTPGYTLDNIDDAFGTNLDTLPFSLDSRILSSGAPTLSAFDTQNRLGFFTGPPLAAQGRTAKLALAQGRRAFVSGFRPLSDSIDITGRVGVDHHAAGPMTWKTSAGINRTGLIPARADGRFHQFEVNIPAEADWSVFHGVEPDVVSTGMQ